MSDTAQGQSLDTLTDDEVMALTPDQIQALMDQEGEDDAQPEIIDDEPVSDPDDTASDDATGDEDSADNAAEDESATDDQAPEEVIEDPDAPAAAEENDQPAEGTPESSDPTPEAQETDEATKDAAPVDPKKDVKPKADEPTADVKAATDFYAEITKPFKADGKDFQVKTAAEAIRLMQMGANYSRRMQEMKPLKAMHAVLEEHGLNDPAKLAQLIDIQKGDPAAIQKLLKDKGIDPLDIDTSKDPTYTAKPYTANEKSMNFQEAINNTLAQEGGKELIADMHGKWDTQSKDALYESPAIFESLLAQKSAVDSNNVSDYSKINAEVERQRVLGYLTDVPFLQAYTQVSHAMDNVGLLSSSKKPTPAVPAKAPIDTGTRKAAEPKTPAPNPNLSSTPPKAAPTAVPNQIDYSTMSDEEFLKLGAPG